MIDSFLITAAVTIPLVLVAVYLDRTKRWRSLTLVMGLLPAMALFVAALAYSRSEPDFAGAWVVIAVLWLLFPYQVIRRRRAARSS